MKNPNNNPISTSGFQIVPGTPAYNALMNSNIHNNVAPQSVGVVGGKANTPAQNNTQGVGMFTANNQPSQGGTIPNASEYFAQQADYGKQDVLGYNQNVQNQAAIYGKTAQDAFNTEQLQNNLNSRRNGIVFSSARQQNDQNLLNRYNNSANGYYNNLGYNQGTTNNAKAYTLGTDAVNNSGANLGINATHFNVQNDGTIGSTQTSTGAYPYVGGYYGTNNRAQDAFNRNIQAGSVNGTPQGTVGKYN